MRYISILLLTLCVTSCATVYDPVAEKYAADAADGLLTKAIYLACEAPTLGSLKRRFNTEAELLRYIKECAWSRTTQPR